MANRWIEFVRKWARDHDTTYGCALSQPACKAEYKGKYGNRKKLTQKKEREMMGMEDVDAPDLKKIEADKKKEKQKESRARWGMAAEDISSRMAQQVEKAKSTKKKALTQIQRKALVSELKRKQEEKKRLVELSRMMGEDYRPKKKAKKVQKMLVIESDSEDEAPAKKSRGRPRKYSSKEEAYKAKIDQNRGYKQAQAQRIRELMDKMEK